MTHNDILRHLRDLFGFTDSKMIAIFSLADHLVTREQIKDWFKDEDDPSFQSCSDPQLAFFLNGLIIDRRGRKEGQQPEPEPQLTQNIIFKKLRIALDLKADDIVNILALTGLRINKQELSAFFRKPGHKHYRACKDPILLKFLEGVKQKNDSALTR